ncbi:DUF2949 domain-containing protein [Nodosilinea sp. P-1105]|uniref:DUF2949 domain-containing protein n=1 Tax=Nodosilinea sp. P-1105 TaxID=2546229 RepID=UPI00146B653C|nr:DUF2949 domain-containing protein [Nodosilinea sp. P-1105]
MSPQHQHQLVNFLQSDLAIPPESIALGMRQTQQVPSLLPMVLWQYGLVTTDQLGQIFDWLEQTSSVSYGPELPVIPTALSPQYRGTERSTTRA